MQIVIDIPKEQYSLIMQSHRSGVARFIDKEAMMYAIKNGTLLPRGHGRLIDADELLKHKQIIGTSNYCEYNVVYVETVNNARPIIEADKRK